MGIQNVNGQPVYVITSNVERARTGRGNSYANLYSDLRWRNWQEVQKSTIAEMGFEQEIYKDRLKAINAEIQAINDTITDIQSGVIDSNQAIQNQVARERNTNIRAGAPTTRVSADSGDESVSTTVSEGTARRSGQRNAGDEERFKATTTNARAQAGSTASAADLAAFTFIEGDAQLAGMGTGPGQSVVLKGDLVADLMQKAMDEQALGNPNAMTELMSVLETRPDYLNAYNSAAPTDTAGTRVTVRESGPSTTTSTSRTAIGPDDVVEGEVYDPTDELAALQKERERLVRQRSEIEAPDANVLERTRSDFAGQMGEGNFGQQRRPTRTRNQFSERDATNRVTEMMDFFINESAAAGGTREDGIAKAREFMLGQARRPSVERGDFLRGTSRDEEIARIRRDNAPITDFEDTDLALDSDAPVTSEQPVYSSEGVAVGPTTSGGGPAEPNKGPRAEAPAPVLKEVPPPSAPAPNQTDLDFLAGRDLRRGPRAGRIGFEVDPNSLDYGDKFIKERAERDRRESAGLPRERTLRERFMSEKLAGVLPIIEGEEPPKGELPKTAKPNAARRRANYQVGVVNAGARLASRPKKFNRIAKPSLVDADRRGVVAEYIMLVDQLYDMNGNNNQDPVGATYREINETYKDDERTRKQAHEYLIARAILEGHIQNPE